VLRIQFQSLLIFYLRRSKVVLPLQCLAEAEVGWGGIRLQFECPLIFLDSGIKFALGAMSTLARLPVRINIGGFEFNGFSNTARRLQPVFPLTPEQCPNYKKPRESPVAIEWLADNARWLRPFCPARQARAQGCNGHPRNQV